MALGACLVLVNAVVSVCLSLGLELQLLIATVRCRNCPLQRLHTIAASHLRMTCSMHVLLATQVSARVGSSALRLLSGHARQRPVC